MQMQASADPPLADCYRALLCGSGSGYVPELATTQGLAVLEHDLPTIDLQRLTSSDGRERDAMASAASEWGFFQVINHGVGRELLEEMRREQARLFHQPFDRKEKTGPPTGGAARRRRRSVSSRGRRPSTFRSPASISHSPVRTASMQSSGTGVMKAVADAMSRVADTVAGTLAKNLGHETTFAAAAGCDGTTCFLRLNRYPVCPFAADTFGLVPHTDSNFLTILCQDQVGAWSNNRYKSLEHKVVANAKAERFSMAYFLCPSHSSPIGSCGEPSPYKPFTFGEYRSKVKDDVKRTGKKIGLPNFLKGSTVDRLSE
ncbi:hypothetical protein ZWY2020_016951 [Hordeum vulgare]|nr:hypothetical protein ZWY2020_016951 [Hordeum vulgare]